MKNFINVTIWILCISMVGIIMTISEYLGVTLGAIPATIIASTMLFIAEGLTMLNNHLWNNKEYYKERRKRRKNKKDKTFVPDEHIL